jgi:hypothetical protein
MTLPTFDPMPFPTLPLDADGVDAFQDTSTVAGRNFDRFSNFWTHKRANYQVFESQRTPSAYATVVNGNSAGTIDIPPEALSFPALSFTIPGWTKVLWYQFFGYVSARDTGVNNYMLFTTQVGGSGLTLVPGPWEVGVYVRNYLYSGSRSFVWKTGEFAPGQQFVATPKVNWWGANSAIGATYYGSGLIQVIAIG